MPAKESKEASDYTRLEQAHYDDIRAQELAVRDLEYRAELAKRGHKLAKDELESALERLRNSIHDGPDPQSKLPGMDSGDMSRETAGPRWRSLPLSLAIHSADIVRILAEEAGLKTIGELADFTAGGKSLVSIKGIGEMAEAKIAEQMQLFWKENPGYVAEEDKPGEAA